MINRDNYKIGREPKSQKVDSAILFSNVSWLSFVTMPSAIKIWFGRHWQSRNPSSIRLDFYHRGSITFTAWTGRRRGGGENRLLDLTCLDGFEKIKPVTVDHSHKERAAQFIFQCFVYDSLCRGCQLDVCKLTLQFFVLLVFVGHARRRVLLLGTVRNCGRRDWSRRLVHGRPQKLDEIGWKYTALAVLKMQEIKLKTRSNKRLRNSYIVNRQKACVNPTSN